MPARRPIPIAVQIYSVRKEAEADLPGVLKAIAKMGYEGVEFAGYYGHSAQDVRKMLDDNRLKAAGSHIRLDSFLGEELPKTIEYNRILGNRFLVVPVMKEMYRTTREGWKTAAGIFNQIAEKLTPHNMRLGYHNHMIEFQPMEGEMPWDTFFGQTRKEVVMQVDTGNALHGGADVVPFISKYPGRALTVHLKEYDGEKRDGVLIGEGKVDWKRCFDVCETVGGTEWYIVEQEGHTFPPMQCIETCLKNVKELLKK